MLTPEHTDKSANKPEVIPVVTIETENTDPKSKKLEDIRSAMAKMSLDTSHKEEQPVTEPAEIPQIETPAKEIIIPAQEISIEQEAPKGEAVQETEILEQTAEEKIVSSASGFELVNIFLSEVKDLLNAGKVLQDLNQKREAASLATQGKVAEAKTLEESSKSIRESINALLLAQDYGQELSDKLKSAKAAMEEYDKAFNVELAKINDDGTKEVNEIISAISEKKSEIKGILNLIGGSENFEKIKKVIRFAERKASQEITTAAVSEFLNDSREFVGNDLPGSTMLANSGDIVGIFMGIVANRKNK